MSSEYRTGSSVSSCWARTKGPQSSLLPYTILSLYPSSTTHEFPLSSSTASPPTARKVPILEPAIPSGPFSQASDWYKKGPWNSPLLLFFRLPQAFTPVSPSAPPQYHAAHLLPAGKPVAG